MNALRMTPTAGQQQEENEEGEERHADRATPSSRRLRGAGDVGTAGRPS